MNQNNNPSGNTLPSIGRLIKSTILAIILAAVVLVTLVLPAEYGIDPTGIGEILGLQRMGEIKTSLAQEVASLEPEGQPEVLPAIDESPPQAAASSEVVSAATDAGVRTDEFVISLAPNEGKEIKLTLAKGKPLNYVWWTDGGKANFDAHADSKALAIKYHNYSKGAEERVEGVLDAAFDGNHGWFWRNRTSSDMVVRLQVKGAYTDVIRVD